MKRKKNFQCFKANLITPDEEGKAPSTNPPTDSKGEEKKKTAHHKFNQLGRSGRRITQQSSSLVRNFFHREVVYFLVTRIMHSLLCRGANRHRRKEKEEFWYVINFQFDQEEWKTAIKGSLVSLKTSFFLYWGNRLIS